MSEIISAGGRKIEITHPDKALFATPRITKLDLAKYYQRVGSVMLPHVRGRPSHSSRFRRGPSIAASS